MATLLRQGRGPRRRELLQSAVGLALPLGLAAPSALAVPAAASRRLLAVGATFPRLLEARGDGSPQGLAVELLGRLTQRLGLPLQLQLYPWARAQQMVMQGQADVLVGAYRTSQREARLHFSQPFFEDQVVFYARRGAEPQWRGDYAALATVAVGQIQGWAYGPDFEQARDQLKHLSTVRDLPSGLEMLRRGRIDLLASTVRDTEPLLQLLAAPDRPVALRPPLARLSGHFAFRGDPQGQAWARVMDELLTQLRVRGELQALARKWQVSLPEAPSP